MTHYKDALQWPVGQNIIVQRSSTKECTRHPPIWKLLYRIYISLAHTQKQRSITLYIICIFYAAHSLLCSALSHYALYSIANSWSQSYDFWIYSYNASVVVG
jgi:hypothetical protein